MTEPLRILGKESSINVRKVLWTCREVGRDFVREDWGSGFQPVDTDTFRAMNPNAQVPVVQVADGYLWESNSICRYLVRKHAPGHALYPADPRQEALCWQWSLWETDRLDRQIVDYVRNTVASKPEERNAAVAEAAWKQVVPAFEVLEGALAKTPWLAGSAFSIADLNVASALYRALSIDVSRWPKFDTWLHTCWDRPAAKKARAMREH